MIDAHKAGEIPDSIRFLRFPPTALVGRHQALSHEVRVDYCRAQGIGIARRVTGGGAIYFDEGQLGWSLVFDRGTLAIASLADLAREICEAAAAGLRKLGVDARYRPRNDIEVGGRKVSGTGGFFDGDTLFYQGTVLVDMDPARMLAALNVPEAKLAKRALDSAAQRVVTLKELLGRRPHRRDQGGAARGLRRAPRHHPDRRRDQRARGGAGRDALDEEIGTDAFVASIDDPAASADVRSASHTGAGGTITAYVRLEGPRLTRLREVLITGDFFVTPPAHRLRPRVGTAGRRRGRGPCRGRAVLRAGAGRTAERRARRFRRAPSRPASSGSVSPMKLIHVVQHTSAEYLGLIEDHLEGRGIRFRYHRPFTSKGTLPPPDALVDGLILLGGGPWGTAGTRDVPTLAKEIDLACACLTREVPVIGIGLGAQILAIAAGGGAEPAPFEFSVTTARRVDERRSNGYLPESLSARALHARLAAPAGGARVLARDPREPGGAVAGRTPRIRLRRPSGPQGRDGRGPDHGVRGVAARGRRRSREAAQRAARASRTRWCRS